MKRKMSKKVLCLCMVAVLAIGLAIPTFAMSSAARIATGTQRTIAPYIGRITRMNTGSPAVDNGNVNIWKFTGDPTQKWDITLMSAGIYRVGVNASPARCLNINLSNNNCNILNYGLNSPSDYQISFSDESSQGGDNCYGIVLPAYVLVAAVPSKTVTNGSNVAWQTPGTYGQQGHQLWYIY